jgi:Calpain family cysteine protease
MALNSQPSNRFSSNTSSNPLEARSAGLQSSMMPSGDSLEPQSPVHYRSHWGRSSNPNLFTSDAPNGSTQANLTGTDVLGQAGALSIDGQLDRNDMIQLLRSTEDGGVVDTNEFNALRAVLNFAAPLMPNYVRVLASKIVNGDAANINPSGSNIGNLHEGSSATQMERLIGKWFLGNDRPVALSYYQNQVFEYKPVSGELFKYGVSHLDIKQGNVGDCYFLSSLAAVAFRSPNTIQNMFTDNGDGTFTVRFYNQGAEDFVTVDRYLPVNSNGLDSHGNNRPDLKDRAVFADWGGDLYNSYRNELWVALAEKAYAQLNESGTIGQDNTNSYNGTRFSQVRLQDRGINGGWGREALHHLTGLSTDNSQMSTGLLGWRLFDSVNDLLRSYNQGEMITLTSKVGEFGFQGTHAYMLAGYNPATDSFRVYNPHGKFVSVTNPYGKPIEQELTRAELLDKFLRWDTTTHAQSTNNSKFGLNSPSNWDVSSLRPEDVNGGDDLPLQDRLGIIQPDPFATNLIPKNLTESGQELASIHYEVEEGTGAEYRFGQSYYSQSELMPGVTLDSEASFEVQAKLAAYAKGELDASISSDGVQARLSGEVFVGGMATADASFKPTIGIEGAIDVSVGADSQGHAEAMTGSRTAGSADLALTLDNVGVQLGGEAFIGSQASADGSVGVSLDGQELAEVHAGAGVQAGIGASANYDIGFEDDTFHFNLAAGLALGIGLEVDWGFSVSMPDFIADPVSDVVDTGSEFISDTWDTGSEMVEDAWNTGSEMLEDVADEGAELAVDTANTVASAVETGVNTVVDTGEKVIETVDKVMPWNWF